MPRHDRRADDQLRPFTLERGYLSAAAGSVLVQAGETAVLCAASVSSRVPEWMEGKGRGWVTAEYNMLPGSTAPRKKRDRLKVDGRTTEIQRLIGRSLRAVVDLDALGERMVTVDCDVLRADGGTRTASITGAFVALADALASLKNADPPMTGPVLSDSLAAVSVGIVDGQPVLDLDYVEDSRAEVDMNVVMTGSGRFVEVQGTGEGATFSGDELQAMLRLAEAGARQLGERQREALGGLWVELLPPRPAG
ncbi:MAG: ribonuclease PH [Planctomycetota bacterium]